MDCESSIHDRLERMLLDARLQPIVLPLTVLKSVTNDFSDDQHIGKGGFADVYKGQLQNGTLVAVKKLSQGVEMDDDKFLKEVDCLMRVKHKNIVRFLGYCADTQGKYEKYAGNNVMAEERERLLCFEFLPNKSLDKYINDASRELEWETRYQIIKGVCEGLHYLHQEFLLHLDLKPANILLSKDMVPKIADFGLSRCFDENKSHTVAAQAAGTLGYMAPELLKEGRITFKSDIYSLGVIILEILTGQRYSAHQDTNIIHEKVLQSCSSIFDAAQEIGLEHVIRVCAELGIECIDYDPAKRPTTRGIIDRLGEMERTHGYIETATTSSANHTHSSIWPPEIDKLLDVHPLELRFPFEPNERIQCHVNLTNKTNRYVGVWITPSSCSCPDTLICFPDSWDHDDSEVIESAARKQNKNRKKKKKKIERGERVFGGGDQSTPPKDPCSYFFQILEPHYTSVVAMTMNEQDEPPQPPQDTGKFEVVMIIMWSEQDLKDLESSIRNKMNMDSNLLKQVEELGGKVHTAMLTAAVICDPAPAASCQATTMTKQIISTGVFGEPSIVHAHPTKSWILTVHGGYVCIWNYQTQKRVMELEVNKDDDRYTISTVKFISRKQWFAAGDNHGYIYVYDYTTKVMVKKFSAHRGNVVRQLVVHATYPLLLSSSGGDRYSIRLWNWDRDWVCIRTFDGHTRGVHRIMFNPLDNDSFASVSDDDTAKVWNINSSHPETTLTPLDAYSADFLFTDSHRPLQLVTSDMQAGCAYIWDLQTRKRVHKLAMRGASMHLVACHPKLPLLVTTWKRTLCLWDDNTYRLQKMGRLGSRTVKDLEFLDTNLPRLLVRFENNNIAILETNLPATTTDMDESVVGPWEQGCSEHISIIVFKSYSSIPQKVLFSLPHNRPSQLASKPSITDSSQNLHLPGGGDEHTHHHHRFGNRH